MSTIFNKIFGFEIGGLFKEKFSRDIMWNILALCILALGGITLNIIIVKMKGPEALGIFNQVYAIYIILSQFGVGGLQFSVIKNISYNRNDMNECSNIFTSALFLVAVFTIVIGMAGLLIAKPVSILLGSPDTFQGLLFTLPGLVFFSMNKVLMGTLNGLSYMRSYAALKSLRIIFLVIGVIVISMLGLEIPYLTLSLTTAEIALFIIFSIFIFPKILPLNRKINIREWIPKHLSFGIRGMFSGILIELNTRVDVLMLGFFGSDASVGIYSFAASLAEGFSLIPVVIQNNLDPIIGGYFANSEEMKISQLAKRTRRIIYPIMGFICLTSIFGYSLISKYLFYEGNNLTSLLAFSIMMIGVTINAGYRPLSGTLRQGGRPGAHTLFVLCLVIGDALLNLFFIPRYGIIGASIVTSLTYMLEGVYLAFFVRKIFRIKL